MGKAIILAIGAYIITLLVAALAALILMTVMNPRGCSDLSQALLALWGMIAVLFLASGVVVGVVTWKIVPGKAGRFTIVAVYGMSLLASYLVIAFGLMVALNC
jgi:hypothetical protein